MRNPGKHIRQSTKNGKIGTRMFSKGRFMSCYFNLRTVSSLRKHFVYKQQCSTLMKNVHIVHINTNDND